MNEQYLMEEDKDIFELIEDLIKACDKTIQAREREGASEQHSIVQG